MNTRWAPERVFVYRHPVDMRDYALRIVCAAAVLLRA